MIVGIAGPVEGRPTDELIKSPMGGGKLRRNTRKDGTDPIMGVRSMLFKGSNGGRLGRLGGWEYESSSIVMHVPSTECMYRTEDAGKM
jgi:hypothetical protein